MKHNVILTGISRGLGLCLFEQLIKRDDLRIIAIGRHFTDAVKAQAYACIAWDFNHPETIPQLTEFLPQDGSLTLINNAGVVLPIGAVGSLDEQAMVQAANVNFISPMLLVNELNKLRRHRPPGSDTLTIVNLSTGAANTPIAGWGA